MRGFVIALQFLTRLPVPRVTVDAAAFAASMRWFPAVGIVIGGIVAAAAWAGARIDSWTGALAALVAWVLVTGALHLDGLADCADAAGAAHAAHGNRDRLLAVLADPHVGSFGTVAIALLLAAKLVLLHGLVAAGGWWPILLVPFAARTGPLLWTWWLPPLHAGLAARFRDAIRPVHLLAWGGALLAAAAIVPALAAAALLLPWWGWQVRRALGGISGDGHGAGIELVEAGLLLATLAAAR